MYSVVHCMSKQYTAACAERATAREEFRRAHPSRQWYIPYPPELRAHPPFLDWLFHEVSLAVSRGERVRPTFLNLLVFLKGEPPHTMPCGHMECIFEYKS
jgi:hypothetical protein